MIRVATYVIVLSAFIASAALAQPVTSAPIDRDLWDAMAKAFDDLPMSLSAHQQIAQILTSVQREAQAREARRHADVANPPADAKPAAQ